MSQLFLHFIVSEKGNVFITPNSQKEDKSYSFRIN